MRIRIFAAAMCAAFSFLPSFALAQSSPTNTEQKVRSFFADNPVMIAIAQCESKFTQFDPSGSALHGGAGHHMIGVFQINSIHRKLAQALGFDINTVPGNLAYAQHLFEQEGTTPWRSSSACWEPLVQSASIATNAVVTKSMLIARLQFQIAEISQKFALLKAAATSTLSARVF